MSVEHLAMEDGKKFPFAIKFEGEKAMWWLFEMIEDTSEKIVYRYARESRVLDGLIEYDKESKLSSMIQPCKSDMDSEWCQRKAIGKFIHFVAEEGFPPTRKVVTG